MSHEEREEVILTVSDAGRKAERRKRGTWMKKADISKVAGEERYNFEFGL